MKRGVRLVLIDPGMFWYSGMATGMLSGQYTPQQDQIDPQALITARGGEFIRDELKAVDTGQRRITLKSGKTLHYDWMSLNVGSEVSSDVLQAHQDGPVLWPVKPIPQLAELRKKLLEHIHKQGSMPPIAVIGGGPTGTELAANLAGLAENEAVTPEVVLISGSERLLGDAPVGASKKVYRDLSQRGIEILLDSQASEITADGVRLEDGRTIPCRHVLSAIGLRAKAITGELGLPADEQGLCVSARMHSVADPHVFAAGDCAHFEPRDLPKLGVFGVKSAEVIHQNLLASIDGNTLSEYDPQKVWLAVLNLGHGKGLLTWWKLWWYGRSALWLKDRIDQRFMGQYRDKDSP